MQEVLSDSYVKLPQEFLLEKPLHLTGEQWDDEDASSTIGVQKKVGSWKLQSLEFSVPHAHYLKLL